MAGPGAAELVKEGLNTHLPSPESLIREEPALSLSAPPADAHVHVHTPLHIRSHRKGLFCFLRSGSDGASSLGGADCRRCSRAGAGWLAGGGLRRSSPPPSSFSQPPSLQKKNKPVHFLCLPAILIPLLSHVFLQLCSSPSSPPFIPPQDRYFGVFDVLLGCRK